MIKKYEVFDHSNVKNFNIMTHPFCRCRFYIRVAEDKEKNPFIGNDYGGHVRLKKEVSDWMKENIHGYIRKMSYCYDHEAKLDYIPVDFFMSKRDFLKFKLTWL